MDEEIKKAVEVLRLGGTILYPTDTIWGIGADATNVRAVDKVSRIKMRNEHKPMILLVPDIESLRHYVQEVPDICVDLIKSVTEPLTIIYPGARNLPKHVIASNGSVGFRIPLNEFCLKLLRAFGKPLTSTSANFSGARPPLSFSKIAPEIRNGVDYVMEYSQESINKHRPSTIVRLTHDGELQILRN